MSNVKSEITTDADRNAHAEYVQAVEALATGIYSNLPKAGFTKDTLTDLAIQSKNEIPYAQVPSKIKLCLIRLAMAMMPKPEKSPTVKTGDVPSEETTDERDANPEKDHG